MPHGILVLSAVIAGITLDGVDDTVFAFLHDTDMIGLPILRAGRAFVVPIEENDLTCRRLKAAVLPLTTVFEPLDSIDAACKLRNRATVDIAALIGTPAHKAGAPFHTAAKAVPAPIGRTACVPHLRERHGDDLAVASGNAVKHLAPEGIVLIGQKLRHLFPLIFVKAELIGHFLRRLVADGDIQIGAGDGDFRFYDVPVPIV